MSQIQNENYLRQYLYNSRVLLIGGGSFNFIEYENGPYDVWIRVNNHYLKQGGLVDVIYTSGDQEPEGDLSHAVVIECRPLPEQEPSLWRDSTSKYIRYDTHMYQSVNPISPEHEFVNKLYKHLNTMPLTGMIAVAHLLSMPIKELHLAAFDFYEFKGIHNHKRDSHLIYPQIEWLADQAIADQRLRVTDKLSKTLNKFFHLREVRRAKYYKDLCIHKTLHV